MGFARALWPTFGALLVLVGFSAAPAHALEGTLAVFPSVTPDGELIGLTTVDEAVLGATQKAFSRNPGLAVVGGKGVRAAMFNQDHALGCRADDTICLSDRARAQRYAYAVTVVLIPLGDGARLDIGLLDVQAARFVFGAQTMLNATPERIPELAAETTERALEPALRVGQLNVVVSEADATVLLDGTAVGTSPLRRPLSWLEAGSHDLEVKKEGFEPFKRRVVVLAGGTQLVDVQLVSLYPPDEPHGVVGRTATGTRKAIVPTLEQAQESEAEGPSPAATLMWVGGGIAAAGLAAAALSTVVVVAAGFKSGVACENARDPTCDQGELPGAFGPGPDAGSRGILLTVLAGSSLAAAGAGGLVAFIGAGWWVGEKVRDSGGPRS